MRIELDRPRFFLGENVLIHLVLENAGAEPFKISFGGDYRGSSRALRFKVTATDAEGKPVPDPDVEKMNMGGISAGHELAPGRRFIFSMPLLSYCQIERPGKYTIRAMHDFGWRAEDVARLTPEATIEFVMPDAAQAEKVVREMEAVPKKPEQEFGPKEPEGAFAQKSPPIADFGRLNAPVYLPLLVARVRGGELRALGGISQMPTQEATKALITLAGDADEKIALEAAAALCARLPDPAGGEPLPTRGWSPYNYLPGRQRLAERAWDPALVDDVRGLAVKYLEKADEKSVDLGAYFTQAAGTPAEGAAVIAALNRALEPLWPNRRDPSTNLLNLPAPFPQLARALTALRGRGFQYGPAVSGEGGLFAYFVLVTKPSPERPKEWLQTLEAFSENGRYPLRETALRSIPEPMPPECFKAVNRALNDGDFGVSRLACEIAGKSGRAEFLPRLLEIMATEEHPWLLRSASASAVKLGARLELYEAWADHLAHQPLVHDALRVLIQTIDIETQGSSGQTMLSRTELLELRKQWRQFLAAHAQEIRDGKRISPQDPTVSPALFGRAAKWRLKDGKDWPAK